MIKKILFTACFFSHLFGQNVYFDILAGGGGTRLWPLSTTAKPKQFLSLDGKNTLLGSTLDRIDNLVPESKICIATTKKFESLVQKICGDRIHSIFIEPALCDTAPAICLNCLLIAKEDPDAIVVFLPADHIIKPANVYRTILKNAINFCEKNPNIVLLGVEPTYPATGFGYIEYRRDKTMNVFDVISFHEKPNVERAEYFLEQGNMLWNAGMFCGKVSVFLDEFKQYAPDVYSAVYDYVYHGADYEKSPKISVDFAVMEKSKKLKVVPLSVEWSDIGNLREFLAFYTPHKKLADISVNSSGNISMTQKKVTAFFGVKDLCVVETPDVLLVADKKQVEDIKKVLSLIKEVDTTVL